jgi:trans-aconitate 2-methyltransferase
MTQQWNADLYQQSHSYVWEFGKDLLAMLAPQPGETILDAGCGTGQLTAEIARTGARVTGIDASASMIDQARRIYPNVAFEIEDVRAMKYDAQFDAVFSNAVLHWVRPPEAAAAAMARALKPGGRLVVEFGGRGNVTEIVRAAEAAWESVADMPAPELPWYYPAIPEYSSMLENCALEVTFAALFDRPTPLEGGLGRWYEMFGAHWMAALTQEQRAAFVARAEREAAGKLLRDGLWTADYRRLRVMARK